MSSPQPASASYGGSPQSYIPTAQPAADQQYQELLGNQFMPAAQQVPGVNPAYQAYQQATGLYPQAQNAFQQYINNPGSVPQALYGAQQGADIYNNLVAPNLTGAPGALAGGANNLLGNVSPAAWAGSQGAAGGIFGAAQPLQGVGQQILNTGFDPNMSLYNQLSGQARDTANVASSMAGVANTPYGADMAASAQDNFNINWQQQQLQRQMQAAQSANQVQQGISGLYAQGANTLNTGANTYGSGLGSAGAGFNNAGSVGSGLVQGLGQANQMPYQAGLGIGQNILSGAGGLQGILQGQSNLGGQSFNLPQQVMNDLQSYLQLGQAAQQQGLAGGQMGFNQLAGGIGGGIGAANTFLNPNTGLFPNALSGIGSGLSGLFGGGVAPSALSILGLPGGTGVGAFTDAVMGAAL